MSTRGPVLLLIRIRAERRKVLAKTATNRESGTLHAGIHAMAETEQGDETADSQRSGGIGSISSGLAESDEEEAQDAAPLIARVDPQPGHDGFGNSGGECANCQRSVQSLSQYKRKKHFSKQPVRLTRRESACSPFSHENECVDHRPSSVKICALPRPSFATGGSPSVPRLLLLCFFCLHGCKNST